LQYSCAKSFILLVYLAEKLVKVEPWRLRARWC
jgi:hypothetical protein